MGHNDGVTDDPLSITRGVVITDPGLCYHGDLNTLHHMPRPWHTVPIYVYIMRIHTIIS